MKTYKVEIIVSNGSAQYGSIFHDVDRDLLISLGRPFSSAVATIEQDLGLMLSERPYGAMNAINDLLFENGLRKKF